MEKPSKWRRAAAHPATALVLIVLASVAGFLPMPLPVVIGAAIGLLLMVTIAGIVVDQRNARRRPVADRVSSEQPASTRSLGQRDGT